MYRFLWETEDSLGFEQSLRADAAGSETVCPLTKISWNILSSHRFLDENLLIPISEKSQNFFFSSLQSTMLWGSPGSKVHTSMLHSECSRWARGCCHARWVRHRCPSLWRSAQSCACATFCAYTVHFRSQPPESQKLEHAHNGRCAAVPCTRCHKLVAVLR